MSQQPRLSACPNCAEALSSGDRFCGACGYDLSVVPARPRDEPTIALDGPGPSPWRPDGPSGRVESASPAPPPPWSEYTGEGIPPGAPAPGRLGPSAPAWPAPAGESAVPEGSPLPTPPAGGPHPGTARPWPGGPSPTLSDAAGPFPPGDPAGPGAAPHPGAGPLPEAAPHPAVPPQPAARPDVGGPGVRFDRPRGAEAHPPRPPDPRLDPAPPPTPPGHSASTPRAGERACVACRAGRVDHDGHCETCGHAQPRERDRVEQESGSLAAVSDRGLRHRRNEDAFAIGRTALPDGSAARVAVVCDGVSSATRPDEASLTASDTAGRTLLAALAHGAPPQGAMHDAVVAAARAVDALAAGPDVAGGDPHRNAPACTLVGAVVTATALVVGWVGDSRVYWVPQDRAAPAARLTEDDSWAAQMVAAGLMDEAEAFADERAHAITGWLGADAYELEPHTASFAPDRPGVVVVCTDGLWNYAETAGEMAAIVPHDAAERPLHAARVLVGHALDGGGHDNVTVAVVPFPATPWG
ncbi:protein phosphatase 2C domain-containing protein [Streptomyces sp. HSG2]|uniref:protein phosphatase 2C domain-containing protein n=1 Tax=Streptomyces sp. HSG2 TaxID=2797167 RepID=UPI00190479BD|nr:protein phosphatase 2C domain-containing protein [Streptomyces sp. HSG2]